MKNVTQFIRVACRQGQFLESNHMEGMTHCDLNPLKIITSSYNMHSYYGLDERDVGKKIPCRVLPTNYLWKTVRKSSILQM